MKYLLLLPLFLFMAGVSTLHAQEEPIVGYALVTMPVGPIQSISLRSTFSVPINIDVTTVSGQAEGGGSASTLLSNALVALRYDPAVLQPVLTNGQVGAGTTPGFDTPHLSNITTIDSNTVLLISHRNLGPNFSSANANVSNVQFKAIANTVGSTDINIAMSNLHTPLQLDAGAQSLFGGAQIPVIVGGLYLNTSMPAPGVDVDSDGIPDEWEVLNQVDDPNADPDGDTLTNLEEYNQGLNPHDAVPVLTITAPGNDTRFNDLAVISFTGTATDVEDGNLGPNIQWISDIDGVLGVGSSIDIQLTEGQHTVTAGVVDSDGNSPLMSQSVVVTIDSTCL